MLIALCSLLSPCGARCEVTFWRFFSLELEREKAKSKREGHGRCRLSGYWAVGSRRRPRPYVTYIVVRRSCTPVGCCGARYATRCEVGTIN
ncbi:hypothetical protein BZA05DRAFT_411006 [Tricharina praecox]|uniref:uncharacterized protein n=1 Tax=Tricharina praecox TaxID=43433 RepID=UPI00221F5895|nr:uncharacterized protein BZA05DRAFT_411006 [Tricharina praecox]KAI5843247.1 hypothetical protein BZA05DRAFT_411006 [Tricharina praecox]